MDWVRRHWKLTMYIAIIVYYLVGRVLAGWLLDVGMVAFVFIGGGWNAMGRVWDARRRAETAPPPS